MIHKSDLQYYLKNEIQKAFKYGECLIRSGYSLNIIEDFIEFNPFYCIRISPIAHLYKFEVCEGIKFIIVADYSEFNSLKLSYEKCTNIC